MSKSSELATAFGVPPGLVEIIEGIDDVNKSKPKAGPGANQKKQVSEFPFGMDGASGQPGKDDSKQGMPPGAGGAGGPQGAMVSDDAMKQMQQQQADQQAAEMEARQAKDAEEEAERQHQKELRTKAEKEVADDLSDKYLDKDDKIEFYPRMESFQSFLARPVDKQFPPTLKEEKYLCRNCKKIVTRKDTAPVECPHCHSTHIWLTEDSADGYKRSPAGQKSADGYTMHDYKKCIGCGKDDIVPVARVVSLCDACLKKRDLKEGRYVPHDWKCPKCGRVEKDKIWSLWDPNLEKCSTCGSKLERLNEAGIVKLTNHKCSRGCGARVTQTGPCTACMTTAELKKQRAGKR